jgi:hypothetical protein
VVQSTARLFYALKSPENGLVSNLSKNALKITAALSKIMVGTLKIAGGVWEKSKNSRYPSGVALIVYIKLLSVTVCNQLPGNSGHLEAPDRAQRKGEKKRKTTLTCNDFCGIAHASI